MTLNLIYHQLIGENRIVYSKDNVDSNLKIIKNIYGAIAKQVLNTQNRIASYYKNTSIAEIDIFKNNPNVNKMFLVYLNNDIVEKFNKLNIVRPVLLELEVEKNIPIIELNSILENEDNEVILAPFTKVSKIENLSNESEAYEYYKIKIESQELNECDNEEEILESILSRADIINEKIDFCLQLDSEGEENCENIRKLEQLLVKLNSEIDQCDYNINTTAEEKAENSAELERIEKELERLKNVSREIYDERQEKILYITAWKKDIALYLKSEYSKLINQYSEFDIIVNDEKNTIENNNIDEIPKKEEIDENPDQENAIEKSEIIEEEKIEENKVEENIKLDANIQKLKDECQENVDKAKKILEEIEFLILKQQNYARIAESINAKYKALNNAFEMKNITEKLDALLNGIITKIINTSSDNKDEINKISKVNLQIGTLLNYLNNPKSAISKKIDRFDELNIIEENEFKKDVAECIKNIRCEAELRKLNDDMDMIEEQSKFKKFIGKFTGKNRLDLAMLDQIEVRQNAVRKTFRCKMPLARNYSIHEMIAEIEMFIEENNDDDLVTDAVHELQNIKSILKKNFIIIDSKVISIIDKKTGKNLPLSSRKMSKEELLEIDTYKFLSKYGYDKSCESNEPEYQDTTANEIKRIVEYVKSSNIL